MPSLPAEATIMEEDERTQGIFQRFLNIPEQTYEEFLQTFTHTPKETQELRPTSHFLEGQFCKTEISESKESSTENAYRLAEPEHEQIVIGEGEKVGGCYNVDLSCPRRLQVDNYMAVTDLDTSRDSEGQVRMGIDLLPGEAEVPVYLPSFQRCTHLDFQVLSPSQHPAEHEHQGDDVQPFSLDEGFDYDHVVLTPKFPEIESRYLKLKEKNTQDKFTEKTENEDL
ncbi:intraflagellar transport-associated protein [Discoglossus pictus]